MSVLQEAMGVSVLKNAAVKMVHAPQWMVHVIVPQAIQAHTVISHVLQVQQDSTAPNSVTVPCMEPVISSLENASKFVYRFKT